MELKINGASNRFIQDEVDISPNNLSVVLYNLRKKLEDYPELLKHIPVNPTGDRKDTIQANILKLMKKHPDITPTEIASRLHTSANSIRVLKNRLKNKGLL